MVLLGFWRLEVATYFSFYFFQFRWRGYDHSDLEVTFGKTTGNFMTDMLPS